ncbi:MAG TPA: AraC family transcriptional regulator [Mucilaginibacter sp.]|jgi:AraC-like DNA-binding protein
MNARYEDLNALKGTESFRAFRLEVPNFEFNWHYHPEYEITLIESGKGKRLVGDCYEDFEAGDLVMIGKDLPHTWASDKLDGENSSAVVIQFDEVIFQSLLSLKEFEGINKLLHTTRQGLYFRRKKDSEISFLIKSLPNKNGVDKISTLLQILNLLSQEGHILLASVYFQHVKGGLTEKRITRVFQYIQENSAVNINLENVAPLVHLSKSAFCKFFKRSTGKTFSDYVNEIRIGHACHLLAETDKTIADICYSCGFESPTYFNRVFLKKKGITPRNFRNKR